MKGQIFIVVSILVTISLLAIAMTTSITIEPENYLQNYFVNIRAELTETASYALLDGTDVGSALDEYILFSKNILEQKGYVQTVTYSEDSQFVTIDIYLGRGEEYYSDLIIIDKRVYT